MHASTEVVMSTHFHLIKVTKLFCVGDVSVHEAGRCAHGNDIRCN
jgi:hypothetical protein